MYLSHHSLFDTRCRTLRLWTRSLEMRKRTALNIGLVLAVVAILGVFAFYVRIGAFVSIVSGCARIPDQNEKLVRTAQFTVLPTANFYRIRSGSRCTRFEVDGRADFASFR